MDEIRTSRSCLIREFTQKGSFAFVACRTEGGRVEEEKDWIVSDEGHSLPTRCSLLYNINFITHNLGCQSAPEPPTLLDVSGRIAVHTACVARSYKIFLPSSPPLMSKEMCHSVLSHPTLQMEEKTLLYRCIIERPSYCLRCG